MVLLQIFKQLTKIKNSIDNKCEISILIEENNVLRLQAVGWKNNNQYYRRLRITEESIEQNKEEFINTFIREVNYMFKSM